jgi:hypothetical protein
VGRAETDQLADAQAMIAELAAHSAELSAVLHETVTALAALATGRAPAVNGDGDAPAVDRGPLAPDVLEIASLQAQAAGVSVQEYLREAVLARAARSGADDGVAARLVEAREDARRLRAESEALKAQTTRVTAHAGQLERLAEARRRRAEPEGDGRPG